MNLSTFTSKHALALLLIAGVTVLVYGNSLGNSFHFDDEHSLVGNPHIRSLGNIPFFFFSPAMFSRNVGSGMYRPLVLVSYAVNYWLGEYRVRGYHLINIAIHLLVAWLVYGVFRELEFGRNPALLGAIFFGVHPLTAEPVNYIAQKQSLFAAVFAAMIVFGTIEQLLLCPRAEKKPSRKKRADKDKQETDEPRQSWRTA